MKIKPTVFISRKQAVKIVQSMLKTVGPGIVFTIKKEAPNCYAIEDWSTPSGE